MTEAPAVVVGGRAPARGGAGAGARARRAAASALAGRAAVALVLALLPGSAAVAAGAPGPGVELPDNPLQGRLIFASRQCDRCHGIAGGRLGIGPNLGEGRFVGTFLELGAALWNHVPGMIVTLDAAEVAWPRLAAEESRELICFLYFIDYLGRPGVAEAGERAFRAKGCDGCHAVGGGEAHLGPDLAELEGFASPLYVAQQIWNHGPSMIESMRLVGIPAPTFEPGDFADLSAFIRQRAETAGRQRLLLNPGNPNRGGELFASKGCSRCHGRMARGGEGGPDLARTDLHRSADAIAGVMWNHSLAMRDVMSQRGIEWPEFRGGELADLVAFLYFLPFVDPAGDPRRGAEVYRTRSCTDCHGADGGGERAPDLGASAAAASPASLVAAMWNHAPGMRKAILQNGLPWPELTGRDLRDLLAFLAAPAAP